jgi:hypothetical protein
MPQRFKTLMSDNQELRTLLSSAQILTELQQQLNYVLPGYLAHSCQVLGLHQGSLSIAAPNGTLAAKLRQLAPDLAVKLQDRGCRVNNIRVKVQVSFEPLTPKKTPRKLSHRAEHELLELSQMLKESPLKLALEKLSRKTS